jgi:hypothetical protein
MPCAEIQSYELWRLQPPVEHPPLLLQPPAALLSLPVEQEHPIHPIMVGYQLLVMNNTLTLVATVFCAKKL